MSFIALDYLCAEHGPFESFERRPAPEHLPCPDCGAASERMMSAPLLKTTWAVAATTGKSDPPPPSVMNTELIADGHWDKYHNSRQRYWQDWREQRIKRSVS